MRHNHPGQPLGWPEWLLRTSCFWTNSRETSTEKRKREEEEGAHDRKTSPTPVPRELERDARVLEKQSGQGWVAKRSGLLALWPLGCGTGSFCSSQTRNLSLSFSELLVATCGVQNLERPPNSLQHAMIPATTVACIIPSAGLDTLSPATVCPGCFSLRRDGDQTFSVPFGSFFLSLRHNRRVCHSITLCTDATDRSVVDLSGFFATECRDRDGTKLIHVKETSHIY